MGGLKQQLSIPSWIWSLLTWTTCTGIQKIHTPHEGHETNACQSDRDEDEIQQAESFEKEKTQVAKDTCEDDGMEFGDCDVDVFTTTLQPCTDGYYRRLRSTVCTDGLAVGISNRAVGKFMAKPGENWRCVPTAKPSVDRR
ncbi:hypothetical protein PIB30_082230, partial [Stylosanthes scabra]|nr:hypothetical protein [Stylosanthes scabra]